MRKQIVIEKKCFSLAYIAKEKYGTQASVLMDMIRINNPILHEKIQCYYSEKKRLLPPIIIEEIYNSVGKP